MICLDTNAVIAVLNASSESVRARLAAAVLRREAVAISVVVLYELRYGVAKSANRQRASRRIKEFLSGPDRSWTSRQTMRKKPATSVHRWKAPELPSDLMTF